MPPDPEPRSITAREELTLRGADGATVALPHDLDAAVVQVYARDGEGEWTVHAGEGTAAGTLHVAAVPAGGAWLRVDYLDTAAEPRPRNEYFWIDGAADAALDLGTWRVGRTGVEPATTIPTELALAMSGLAPWQPGLDLAIVYSPTIGFAQVFDADGEGISGMPAGGATAADLRVDWAGAVGGPLLDAARGDRAVMLQFRFREVGGMFVGAAVRAAALPAFTIEDGGTTTVTAALAEPAPLALQVAMDRDAFDAQRPALAGPAFGRGFAVSAQPGIDVAAEFSSGSTPAELVVVDGDLAAGGALDLGAIAVASPFAASSAYATVISAYPVLVERDDGVVATAAAQVGVITNALPVAGTPAAPIIGPVRNVTIADRDAFTSPAGVGLAPEIRWEAPALGAPVEYEVRILAPGGADPTYDFVWFPSAIFHVPGDQTALALPPEVLVPDLPYAIAIRAITHSLAADARARAPRHLALPYGWADTITPAFKP